MRLLVRLAEIADAQIQRAGLAGGNRELVVRQRDIVRRLALPYLEDHVDRVLEYLESVLLQRAERLGIGHQGTRADTEDEAPAREVVHHRGMRGDQDRMHLRDVGRPRLQLDRLRPREQGRQEEPRVGYVLHLVRDLPAAEGDIGIALWWERVCP